MADAPTTKEGGMPELLSKVNDDTAQYNEWVEVSVREGTAQRASLMALKEAFKNLEELMADDNADRCKIALQDVTQLSQGLESGAKEMLQRTTDLETRFSDRIAKFRNFEKSATRALWLGLLLLACFIYLIPACIKNEELLTKEFGMALLCGFLLLCVIFQFGQRRQIGNLAKRILSVYGMKWSSLQMVSGMWGDIVEASGWQSTAFTDLAVLLQSPTPTPETTEEKGELMTEIGTALEEECKLFDALLEALGPNSPSNADAVEQKSSGGTDDTPAEPTDTS